ncbi:GAF domain-containing protein [Natronincola peptidivorans]|uniref:GAF domain-containing protein n=1 Tax=Natronincola peptidivorans TaxID=426128 RepID=A0A1I0DRX4_9FIRM|nr:HD domain-containing phosphohydrolase [Natronincola peptidivorans]SET34684.1 GAF domain-containing protein [Natronincola peptidivorans]
MIKNSSTTYLKTESFRQESTPEEKLKLFVHYAGKIANETKLDLLLKLMADLGRDLVVADRCTLWIYDKEANELWARVAHGIEAIRIPADLGVVGHVVKTREPYLTNNTYEDQYFNPRVDQKTCYRSKSLLALPLFDNEGEVIGVYQAVNKITTEGAFTSKDIEHLMLAASYSANALINAMLMEEIEKTQKEIVFLMGQIGESRSKETAEHIRRVTEVSKLMATLYGMSQEEVELIKMASPMHDIGKIAIPDTILNKPGKLTEEEYATVQKHTVIGYQLLKNSPRKILKASAIIAHQHHEKWNGKGYPRGLKGEEIHPFGRICAIADVFDALISERCYKPAWSLQQVFSLFEKEKGEHFDPHMTQLFLDNFDSFVAIIKDGQA